MRLSAGFTSSVFLALRARYLGLVVFSVFSLLMVVVLAAQFSGRQPAAVALDVGLSVIRLILPLVVIFLGQELVFREFECRYFLVSLSYPEARSGLLLGRFLAIVFLGLILLCVMSLVLAAAVCWIEKGYAPGTRVALGLPYLVTLLFVMQDLLVVVAVTCFLGVVASTSSFVLIGAFGFMLVARSYASVIELLVGGSVVSDAETYRSSLGLLGYLLPDLGALDVRMMALYGRIEFLPGDWPWLVLSSFGYALGFLALAVWALNRKRFA